MKFTFTKTPLGMFRLIALLEGISYIVLLCVGMPLKYLAHLAAPIKIAGWAHGMLFMTFMVALVRVAFANKWGFVKILIAFTASLLPFGTFVLDKKLKQEEVNQ